MTETERRKNGNQPVMVSPFVNLQGQWYVITEWRPDEPVPPRLTLRVLTDQESEWLEPKLLDAYAEVWATLFPNDNAIECGGKTDD